MEGASSKTETVKFNVGGTFYEASRSLIETQHSHTVLGRMVSGIWHHPAVPEDKTASDSDDADAEEAADSKPIFIDRDGDNFGYILNFLRYGHVVLPFSASRHNILLDLEFFVSSILTKL
jgi:hypothetical protein